MIRRVHNIHAEESGMVLVLMAAMLTVFIGMAALAVDFGWLYWNGIKVQHGADAAALSGVIYEPGNRSEAYAQAVEAAGENGYVHGAGSTVDPTDYVEDVTAVHNANQLKVTVTTTIPTFFMTMFGIETLTIEKHAIAEYVLPLAMGSDLSYFGSDPERDNWPNLWANIHGYYTGRSMGDRFSSQCNHNGNMEPCARNPERRETTAQGTADSTGGYLYGLDVAEGFGSVTVQVLDGPFYRDGKDQFLVGDNPQGNNETLRDQGPTTRFMLFEPDPTPLDTTDNVLACSIVTFGSEDNYADFDGDDNVGSWDDVAKKWIADPDDDQNTGTAAAPVYDGYFDWNDIQAYMDSNVDPNLDDWDDLWDDICTISGDPGIYPLRVVIDNPGSNDDRGLNRYSLRTSGGPARLYALGDMAIYANVTEDVTEFTLAEIGQVHAGKDLVIELWDPDSGNKGVQIQDPYGTTPQCTWNSTDGRSGGPMGCDINYGTSFNDDHMQIRINIDDGYACAPETEDCWWKIFVKYPGGANDTTTWSARIEGNPVRLVE